jgi:hypothetical protein
MVADHERHRPITIHGSRDPGWPAGPRRARRAMASLPGLEDLTEFPPVALDAEEGRCGSAGPGVYTGTRGDAVLV